MSDNRWDLKQVGSGAGVSAVLLILMQSQGVNLMTDKQNAQTQIVIEKTVANAQRIDRNEAALQAINEKIDVGFQSLRDQIAAKRDYIIKVVEAQTRDRYTKTEHVTFAESQRERFSSIEKDIKELEGRIILLEIKGASHGKRSR